MDCVLASMYSSSETDETGRVVGSTDEMNWQQPSFLSNLDLLHITMYIFGYLYKKGPFYDWDDFCRQSNFKYKLMQIMQFEENYEMLW